MDGGGSAVVAWRALAALDDSFTLAMGRQTVTCYAAATNKREQMLPYCLSTLTRGFEFHGQAMKITKEIHNCFMKI